MKSVAWHTQYSIDKEWERKKKKRKICKDWIKLIVVKVTGDGSLFNIEFVWVQNERTVRMFCLLRPESKTSFWPFAKLERFISRMEAGQTKSKVSKTMNILKIVMSQLWIKIQRTLDVLT